MASSWEAYYQRTEKKPPSPLLLSALPFVSQRNDALDLGCGAGNDTKYLLNEGFRVTAVDKSPESIRRLSRITTSRLTTICCDFSDFQFESYDLINAQYSLPFLAPDVFDDVFHRVKLCLRDSGLFVGQFFGIHDAWNTHATHMTFLTRGQVESLLEGMEVLVLDELEYVGSAALGREKRWHVFHVIAESLLCENC
jgi:cyclopropane fatty-acyl-phospholipid synthase-like methyltransferase